MNETPLHEPLIAEEGKEKERVFTGTPERLVNICLASISALIIYWTVYVSADVMWKHGLYIMTVFCMTLVIYPFEKKPKVNHVSLVDWLLIIGSIAGSAYAIWEYLDRFMRLGMLTEMDIFFGCLMLFLGLEVGRRVIGWSLTLVSIVLILYSLYGFVIPGHFGHGGFDLEAVVTQVYAGMEGYYGLSAKMMIQYVAPFILMGAFLEKSGAGDFFIRLAFALTRNTVGGPAKAAVIGSALLGSISGSAVANVSSTGVLTIPMMKKVGYRPHVAGAIEAAASTGGQIMPPIMGAVAFLMAEFTQIPYLTIVTVATGPIILYYITLMAFIHFEAKKHNIGQMKDHHIPSARTVCSEGWHFFVAIMVIIVIMAFVFVVLTDATIEEESAVIGTLLASGYRKREIILHYLALPAIIGILAAGLGCALGVAFFTEPMRNLYYGSYSLPPFRVYWSWGIFIKCAVVPTAALVLITLAGLLRKMGKTPLQFLRHEASGKSGTKRGLQLPEYMGFVARFRLRVFLRNLGNFATLFVGIAFASLLLLFGLAILPTMTHYADNLETSLVAKHQYTLKAPLELEGSTKEREQWAALERLQSTDGALLTAAENAEDELNDATDEAQAAADAAGYGSAAAAFGRQQFCAEGRAGGYGAGS